LTMWHRKDVLQGSGEQVAGGRRRKVARPPTSVNRVWATLLGLAGLVIALATSPALGLGPAARSAFIVIMTAAPVLALDLALFKVHRRASTGLDWSRPPDFSVSRSLVKIAGLAGTLLVIALAYWTFPEYRDPYYSQLFDLAWVTLPYLAIPTLLYIVVVDAYMIEPRDGYWHAGCLFLGLFSDLDRETLRQFALGWLVKAFYIPFMFPPVAGYVEAVYSSAFFQGESGFIPFYKSAFPFLYLVDVTFANVGYFLTLRVTDTHIRSTEPTILGWLVAIMCYPPFWPLLYDHFFPYMVDTPYWGPWLSGQPVLQAAWGTTILVLIGVYSWATVIFGCRFSNLTHRGILTNGPYRLTKHPAYLAKNISWWLVAVPFASKGGWAETLRVCAMLAAINFIYYMRARTEERHLSRDPDYVAYALWMNEHALLSWLGAIIPALRYRPPPMVFPTDRSRNVEQGDARI